MVLGQGDVSWRITQRVSRRVSVSPRGGNLVSSQGGDVLGVVVGLGEIVGSVLGVGIVSGK